MPDTVFTHPAGSHPRVRFESRMLIGGELVDGRGTFDNINPATEEVLGAVADASELDMRVAIDAARRAFDETAWSTDHAVRQRCLLQLQDALESEREELREELIPRPAARGRSRWVRNWTRHWRMRSGIRPS